MASKSKTSFLALNQWAPEDSVLREDFNADNSKLDAAVKRVQRACGVYSGGGHITLGFAPSAVEMCSLYGDRKLLITRNTTLGTSYIQFTSNGFTPGYHYADTSSSYAPWSYVAWA